jgi:signal transduction histidine kinase
MGNPDQIHQVLMAFGTNAVQAMENQGGILTVAVDDVVIDAGHELASHELTPGKYARILFSDTGPGISTVNLNSIFDPYFTTKDVGQGVGMGLSMAHGIVDNHGGKIMVRSEVGKGAEFTVFLPVIENRP